VQAAEMAERAQQRRLPGAVRAQHGERLTCGDVERRNVQQLAPVRGHPQVAAADPGANRTASLALGRLRRALYR
jgi:hypothetical protein